MPEATCSIPGCVKPRHGRGWCIRHYGKWRKTGDPHFEKPDAHTRLMSKVEKVATGCWLWTGFVDQDGYGKSWDGRQVNFAHRVVYQLLVGAIPDGYEVDHVCHSIDPTCSGGRRCAHRRCVNPEHLEAVTHLVNNDRCKSRRTHCRRGHALDEENIYRWPAKPEYRGCRTCRRDCEARRVRPA